MPRTASGPSYNHHPTTLLRVSKHVTLSDDHPLFTVFTPTFDRAHTLGRVYACLQDQTFRDFEWLIVDDGSTDDTATLVEG